MPHNFDSGIFLVDPAWHGLGTVIREPISASEAIVKAGLNWEVVKQSLCRLQKSEVTDKQSFKPISEYNAIVREDTDELFAVRHESYQIFQNWEAFRWLEEFIEKGYLIIDTAISLAGGKQVAITCKIITEPAEIIKGDYIEPYLLFKNDHSGNGSIGFVLTPVRVVCANTLSMAVGREDFEGDIKLDKKNFRIRHVGNVSAKAQEAKDLIDFQKRCFNDGMDTYREMAKYNLPRHKFGEFLQGVFSQQLRQKQKVCLERGLPKPSIWDLQVVKNVVDHYNLTCEQMPEIEGTLYSAVQAVSGAVTHSKHRLAIQSQLFGRGKETMAKSLRQAVNLMIS